MSDDYYKTLEINRDASQSEIEKAYRKLARKYHPDLNPDDRKAKENFQKVQQAYDVLNDSEKREMYDRYGSSFESMGGGPGGGPGPQFHTSGGQGFQDIDISQLFGQGGGGGGAAGFGGFEDILHQFGGGGPQRRQRRPSPPRRGADLHHDLAIPFNTAITGGEAHISVRRASGKVESINVKIPAGVEDGQKIRLREQGEQSPSGGKSGDLLIAVKVAKHPCFVRRGRDLEVTVPVSLGEAAAGGKIDVPTPQGVISLTIPPASSSGKRLRLKGLGVPSKDGTGDLYAIIEIALPAKLDQESIDLVRQFDERNVIHPRNDLKW